MEQLKQFAIFSVLLTIAPFSVQGAVVETAGGCTIEMPRDILPGSPVITTFTNGQVELFKPSGRITKLSTGSTLFLFCTGKGNTIKGFSQQSMELVCKSDKVFQAKDGQNYRLTSFECEKEPKSELQVTEKKCSNGLGIICNSGFRISSSKFLTVYSICFDVVDQRALYSKNQINGPAIRYKLKGNHKPFKADIMKLSTRKIHKIYTIKNQIRIFERDVGFGQQFINKTMFFSRGHLAPDADFVTGYEQHATYFYENVAPTYQTINSGNWVRGENLARMLAIEYNSDLEVYTGSLGILKLKNNLKQNKHFRIYLDDDQKVKVPEWYFKVIRHPKMDAAVVLITLNNPFANRKEISEFCPNVCDQVARNLHFFADITKGYTFCCELNAFQNVFPGILDEVTANRLLTERFDPDGGIFSFLDGDMGDRWPTIS